MSDFFLQFFEIFYFMSIHFRFRQYHHHNLNQILHFTYVVHNVIGGDSNQESRPHPYVIH